jgi:hypothetical protein
MRSGRSFFQRCHFTFSGSQERIQVVLCKLLARSRHMDLETMLAEQDTDMDILAPAIEPKADVFSLLLINAKFPFQIQTFARFSSELVKNPLSPKLI